MFRQLRPHARRHKVLALAISAVLVLSLATAISVADVASASPALAAQSAAVEQVAEKAPAAAAQIAEAAFATQAQVQAAESGCIPDPGYTNCSAVTYSGGDQTFTVPSNITSLKMKAWGAGGGGVDGNYSKFEAGGGGGGYTTGTLAVTPGQNLTVVVGQGGRSGTNVSTARTYGGGGAGGSHTTNGTTASDGGSGGGFSGVFLSAGKSATDATIISGGGGGAAPGVSQTSPVELGTAKTYSVLGTDIANTGTTKLTGDLGTTSVAVPGFPPGTLDGVIHANDAQAAQAQVDLLAAYIDADGRAPGAEFSGDLNGRTFTPGVYHSAAAMALTGTLTLDGQGDPNAVFIFQVDAALNTAAASIVKLINGAQASHVVWQSLGAAGTGANSSFSGTILAEGAITIGADGTLIGRALSRGVVTMANNQISTVLTNPDTGGAGGITGGQSTQPATSGRGGTATAGGAAATAITNCSGVQAGGQFQGGNGADVSGATSLTPNEGGGGGGGGLFGGGGGRCQMALSSPGAYDLSGTGGGGSSHISGNSVTASSTVAGINGTAGTPGSAGSAGNDRDSQYVAGVGAGGSVTVAEGGNGGNGLVVFQWNLGYTIAKSASALSVTPGAVLTYGLTITNASANPYTASAPAGFSDDLSGVLDDATYNANASSTVDGWNFTGPSPLVGSGPLAVGETATITYSVTVTSPDTGNDLLTNTITSTKAEGSCGASCGTSTPVITAATTCATPATLPNGSFEAPVVASGAGTNIDGASSPLLWNTTATDNKVELWANGGSSQSTNGGLPITGQSGSQWVELNANDVGALFQDVTTIPGQALQWSVWHRARGIGGNNTTAQDVMQVQIGTATSQSPQVPTGQATAVISDGPLAWGQYSGAYTVPAGQTTTRFQFAAISSAAGDLTVGNFIDNLVLGSSPCLATTTSSQNLTTGAGGLTRPGDTLRYTVTTTNNGGEASSASVLSNAIPAGTTYVPGSLTVGGSGVTDQTDADVGDVTGTTVTARLGSGASASAGGAIAVGASVSVMFTVQVNVSITAGTVIAEVAAVNYAWPPSVNAISGVSTTTANVVSTASVTLAKSVDSVVDSNSNGRVDAGDQVHYAFEVTNSGSAQLTDVAVADNKVGAVSCPTTTLAGAAVLVCTATYIATAADSTVGVIVNTATAAGTPPSGAARISSAPSSVTTPMYMPSLSVIAAPASSTFAAVGENTVYTAVVTNGGSTQLTAVNLSSEFTAPATPNPVPTACTLSLPAVLAPGAAFTCTFTYAANQEDLDNGKIVATMTAVGTNAQPAQVTATSNVTVTAVPAASLAVTTTATPTRVTAAGQTIGYSFAVTNTGNVTVTGISIVDTFTAPAGPVPTITCTATTLAPGAGTTCTAASYAVLTADITAGGVVNSATATGTSSDDAQVVSAVSTVSVIAAPPVVSFAPAPGEVAVAYAAQPTVTGGDGPFAWSVSLGILPDGVTIDPTTGLVSGTPTEDGNFSMTIKAIDSEGVEATSSATFVITKLPTLTFISPASGTVGVASSTTFTVSGGTAPLTWSISVGTLPPGLTLNAETGVMSGTPTTAGTYSFAVSVADTYGMTDSKAVGGLVIAAGALVITKTADVTSVVAGGTVLYTITVSNTGSTVLNGVTLNDQLTDVLDDAAYNTDAGATAGTVTYSAQTLGWSGNLAAGTTVTITYSVTVGLTVSGDAVLKNQVESSSVGSNCAAGSTNPQCRTETTIAATSISLTGLTPSFTLNGPPNSTVSADGAVVMTVTTNSASGYTVSVRATASALTAGTSGNTDVIPIAQLGVRETGTTLFGVLSTTPQTTHQQNSPSATGGDAVSNDYQIQIPFVAPDIYSTTLEYIVTAQ